MGIRVGTWIKKIGYGVLVGTAFLVSASQDPWELDRVQEELEVVHERDEKAWGELQDWLWDGAREALGNQGEQELLDISGGERFMASEPRRLITPVSPESLSGDYADGEESSASREHFEQQSRSVSRDGSGNDDTGSEEGYTADFDEPGRRFTKPRLIRQQKVIIPAVLRSQARAQSWTYAQGAVQSEAGQPAHREPTNDHRAHMELLMQEMRDGSYTS